ncbi:MAG: hypothetical protein AB7T09_16030 [Planctomycetota bacterium]
MRRLAATLPLLLLLPFCLTSPARADGPTAELEATLVNAEGGGGILELSGKVKNVPDGTKLHITLVVKGVAAEASFFVTIVEKEAFKARKSFGNQQFAPLAYVLSVDLLLSAQRRATGEFIRREWGLPSGAKVTLAQKQLDIGTLEEQNAFRLQTIKDLLGWVTKSLTICDGLTQLTSTPAASADKAKVKEHVTKVRTEIIGPFNVYLAKYVVLPELSTVGGINNAMSMMGKALNDWMKGPGEECKRLLLEVATNLNRLKDELESRLPESERPKKDEKKDGGTTPPAKEGPTGSSKE